MYSDWHRCSFGAQLLKDKTCVLRNNQMNPQLAQGSRRDLRADQGADSNLPGIQHPHHPQGQAQNLRAPSRIISILLITQACLLKKHSLLSLTGIVPV